MSQSPIPGGFFKQHPSQGAAAAAAAPGGIAGAGIGQSNVPPLHPQAQVKKGREALPNI